MGFSNPLVAGIQLIRSAIRSANYVAGVSGWTINRDGTAEFSAATVRGILIANTFRTTDLTTVDRIVINPLVGFSTIIFPAANQSETDFRAASIQGDSTSGLVPGTNDLLLTGGVKAGLTNRSAIRLRANDDTAASGELILEGVHGGVRLAAMNGTLKIEDTSATFHDGASGNIDLFNGQTDRIPDKRHFQLLEGNASTTPALTNVAVTVATISVTTIEANAVALVVGTVDFSCTTIEAGQALIGELFVDGVAETPQIIMDTRVIRRNTLSRQWGVTLAAAGSHTLDLRTRKLGAVSAGTGGGVHTGIVASVWDFMS